MSWGLAVMACTPGTPIPTTTTGGWGVWCLRRWGILSCFAFFLLSFYSLVDFACFTGNLFRFTNLGTFWWFLDVSDIRALLVCLWMLGLLKRACSSKISKILLKAVILCNVVCISTLDVPAFQALLLIWLKCSKFTGISKSVQYMSFSFKST